jgi:hypothetical protein
VTTSGRSTWLQPPHTALLVRALLVLVRIRLDLWRLPWSRVAAIVAPQPTTPSRFTVVRLERAVQLASRVVPGATCLTQALALNQLLSSNGHASTVLIGVRKDADRFAAHAWVESNGRPLLSSPAEVTQYSRFLTWPPHTT